MREPSFWWGEAGLASSLLAPLAMVYGAVADFRLGAPGRRAGVPVVCAGNLTVGGGGKTPTALAVARLLAHAGERPTFLSRGYGGRLAGPLRVDPARHRALDVGDEPLLLARVAPTVIARDRIEGARMAVAGGASVIVMDDGFQNPSLAKDLSLLVVDARRGVGNGRIVPAGPLRAPARSQLARAHALVVIGTSAGAEDVIADARVDGLPVLHARLRPDAGLSATLAGGRVLAFAGIADPQKFFATLAEAGIAVGATRSFPDHHRYTPREALALCDEADHKGLALVTTEKDLVRLTGDDRLAHLAAHAHALPVTLAFENAQAFKSLVLEGIAAARAKSHGSEKVHSEKD
jgi:tetraacyldisaccharide 4'-kinase